MNHTDTDTDTGGAAFPSLQEIGDMAYTHGGMALRQFASIKLKVPNSGTDWLDTMIRESLRDDFAGQALAGILANPNADLSLAVQEISKGAYTWADAMLKAREAGDGES